MKVVSLIESRQEEVVRRILKYCGIWVDPPPSLPGRLVRRSPKGEGGSPPAKAGSPPQEERREIVREPFYDGWVTDEVSV